MVVPVSVMDCVRGGALALVTALVLMGCSTDDPSPDRGAIDGKALYGQNCASCHGSDLRGTANGPSHPSSVYEPRHHPDDSFRAAVRRGATQHHWDFGDMPAVEGIEDKQIDAIIDYIRSRQEDEGFEPYPPTGAAEVRSLRRAEQVSGADDTRHVSAQRFVPSTS